MVEGQDKKFNNEAREIVSDLENFMKDDIRGRLEDQFGSDWGRDGIPSKLRRDIAHRAVEKNSDLP